MNKREAMIQAHRIASLCIRQHLANAIDGLADGWDDSAKIAEALEALEMRHWRAAQPKPTTPPS